MLKKRDKRPPLLKYWTTRYLITLVIGLIIIGVVSSVWIKNSNIKKRLDIMNIFAAEIVDRVVDDQEKIRISPYLSKIIERREKFLHLERFLVLIVDENRNILFTNPRVIKSELIENISLTLENSQSLEKLVVDSGEKFYFVKQKIQNNKQETIGWVMIFNHERNIIANPEELKLLGIMLGALALLGWGVIYLLTKKLSQPIMEVAEASNQIVIGNYDIHLDKNFKEQEIYELVNSFKQMADRLRQLESLRTELLAGVTHELKTPVTSISALVQAIRDGVVTDEEAQEFLDICSSETQRLQKMVEDLLDFNSFAIGAIKVQKEQINANELVQEIVYQWKIGQEESLEINTSLPIKPLSLETDPMRVRQILYNLLNNAKQVISDGGIIDVILYKEDQEIKIDVHDNGTGISAEEQDLVFERFYRGKSKIHNARGLGLGLPFSKMLAKALGGDLNLKESSSRGTTFTLKL